MTLYRKSPQKPTNMVLELIKEISKATGCKLNKWNSKYLKNSTI